MAIILTLTAIIWNEANPGQYRNGLNAFVVGLLWLKVLAFLKIVNKQMSTFIYAVSFFFFFEFKIQILMDSKCATHRSTQFGRCKALHADERDSPPGTHHSLSYFIHAANADTL